MRAGLSRTRTWPSAPTRTEDLKTHTCMWPCQGPRRISPWIFMSSDLRAQMSLRLREVANSSWSNTPTGEYTYIVLKITTRIKNLFGPCVDVYSLYTCNFDYIMYPPKYGLKCLFGYCCCSSNSSLTVSVAPKIILHRF